MEAPKKPQTLTGFEKYTKTARRAQFLAYMDQIIPWPELAVAVQTAYPKVSEHLSKRNKLGKVLLTAVSDHLRHRRVPVPSRTIRRLATPAGSAVAAPAPCLGSAGQRDIHVADIHASVPVRRERIVVPGDQSTVWSADRSGVADVSSLHREARVAR